MKKSEDNLCCNSLEGRFLQYMQKIELERRQKGEFVNFEQIKEVRRMLMVEDLRRNISNLYVQK